MSSSAVIIDFRNVSKTFTRRAGHMLVREHIARFLKRAPHGRFQAVKNLTFTVRAGESVALVGHNGAGKSTILAMIAGLSRPDSGVVTVRGPVAALFELGSGFHGDLSGRENLSLYASLLGYTREETKAHFDEIVEFSGISDFLDQPLRTYSSGMIMRLAFSIAVHRRSDILLIDEILAVGDAAFQEKCAAKIREIRDSGTSLICVSHGAATVRELCDRALWMDHGELVMDSTAAKVLDAYAGIHQSTTI